MIHPLDKSLAIRCDGQRESTLSITRLMSGFTRRPVAGSASSHKHSLSPNGARVMPDFHRACVGHAKARTIAKRFAPDAREPIVPVAKNRFDTAAGIRQHDAAAGSSPPARSDRVRRDGDQNRPVLTRCSPREGSDVQTRGKKSARRRVQGRIPRDQVTSLPGQATTHPSQWRGQVSLRLLCFRRGRCALRSIRPIWVVNTDGYQTLSQTRATVVAERETKGAETQRVPRPLARTEQKRASHFRGSLLLVLSQEQILAEGPLIHHSARRQQVRLLRID